MFGSVSHRPVKPVLTLHNLLLARACALHDSSHYRCAPPRILCFRAASTERKQSSRMRDTRPSSRAGAHVAAARPIITQRGTCASSVHDRMKTSPSSRTDLCAVLGVIDSKTLTVVVRLA